MVAWGMFTGVKNSRGSARRVQVEKAGVRLVERTIITSLFKRDGRVVGGIGFPMEEGNAVVINARAVVMCTGSGTFKTPGWPAGHSLTHDGEAKIPLAGLQGTLQL
jgi:succinate dehydrogenase/fumarate reductase flavoprotein subunit